MKSKNYAIKSNIFFIVPICFIILLGPLFVDIPKAYSAELQFVEKTSEAGLSQLRSSWGLCWGDIDQDGWEDLYIKNHNVFAPSLYHNLRNGKFEEITNHAGLNFIEDSHGASWGDFDNDGDMDLIQVFGARGYVHGTKTKTNFLFQNDGNGIFTDIAESAGVRDTLGRGRTPIWFDYNNDGKLDLFLGNAWKPDSGFTPSVLFKNEGNGVISDVTETAGLAGLNLNGAHIADINGDALMDLIVSRMDLDNGILLYKNNGDGTFSDITNESGLSNIPIATDLSLGDYDNDGDIDIFVCMGHLDWPQDAYETDNCNIYYRITNKENKEKCFIFDISNSSIVQFDLYFYKQRMPTQSIYIGSNKYQPNDIPFLLDSNSTQNQGEPTQTDPGVYIWFDQFNNKWHILYKLDISRMVCGILSTEGSIGQVDPVNLDIDSYNFTNRLFQNSGDGQFTDVTESSGLDQYFGDAQSAVFADFDNDSDLDIYVVYSGGIFNEPNGLYANDGQGCFTLVPDAGAQALVEGRGESVAVADYNNDGFLDMAITNGLGGAPFHLGQRVLLENQGNDNNWIQIKLVGNISNRGSIGSIVNLEAGLLKLTKQQTGGMHTYSQNSQVLQFGLGNKTIVDKITVYWPSGIVQQFSNISSNQRLTIEEPIVSLTLSPDTPTVVQGGLLVVQTTIGNHTSEYQPFLFGTIVNLPNGNVYPNPPDALFGPKWATLAPYETKSEHMTHNIPGDAPIGKYLYHGYIGKGLWNILNEHSFEFTVITSPSE